MPVEKSPFYEPFLEMPPSISAEVQGELREEARTVIREDVIQSYKDLGEPTASYLPGGVLPSARYSDVWTQLIPTGFLLSHTKPLYL